MSIDGAIDRMISDAFDNAEWSDILDDEFASLTSVSDLENDVDNLKTELEELQTETKFTRYVEAIESVDKLQATVDRLASELDAIKNRKTILDFLKFWSK